MRCSEQPKHPSHAPSPSPSPARHFLCSETRLPSAQFSGAGQGSGGRRKGAAAPDTSASTCETSIHASHWPILITGLHGENSQHFNDWRRQSAPGNDRDSNGGQTLAPAAPSIYFVSQSFLLFARVFSCSMLMRHRTKNPKWIAKKFLLACAPSNGPRVGC